MRKLTGILFPMLLAFIVTYILAAASTYYGINTTTIIAGILIVVTGFSVSIWLQRIFFNEQESAKL